MTAIHEGDPLAPLRDDDLPLQRAYHWEATVPDEEHMVQPLGGGRLDPYTWSRTLGEARRVAAYLQSLNLPAGSSIALVTKNCAHHIVLDLAIWMAGHVPVSIYPTVGPDTLRFVLEHAEARLLFVGKVDGWDAMAPGVPDGLPLLRCALSPSVAGARSYADILATYTPIEGSPVRSASDVAMIIYTSGSTGAPKGVVLSFDAAVAFAHGALPHMGIGRGDRVVSYLPLAHAMERLAVEMGALYHGIHISFVESLDTFLDDLRRIRPTVFQSVPRLWLKFRAGVEAKMGARRLAWLLRMPVLGSFLRRRILAGLGLDRVRIGVSGSAPIPAELCDWYQALGLPIVEGYGMTENGAVGTAHRRGHAKAGTVGEPLPGVSVRIAEDGEIQMKSPGVMRGYHKEPELTAATFTDDGWLRTGDRGEIGPDGHVRITGRTKELFKTSKGKYVAPAPIENRLNVSDGIDLSCVMGSGLAQPIAVVALDESAQHQFDNGGREAVLRQLEAHRRRINGALEGHEQLGQIVVSETPWTIENGLLTPTMKIRRSAIEAEHAALIAGDAA